METGPRRSKPVQKKRARHKTADIFSNNRYRKYRASSAISWREGESETLDWCRVVETGPRRSKPVQKKRARHKTADIFSNNRYRKYRASSAISWREGESETLDWCRVVETGPRRSKPVQKKRARHKIVDIFSNMRYIENTAISSAISWREQKECVGGI